MSLSLAACLLLAGCGSESETETKPPGEEPGCGTAELELSDGTCLPVGVPPDGCAEGFDYADGGCIPIVPAEPCPPGLMAVPGDTECREVGPCGEGAWGDIPIEPGTVFVDGSYGGGDSDGSEARPFTTVVEAVAAAPDGGLIAIAAGSYVGEVGISQGARRLWGRCPAMVELVAVPGDVAAIFLLSDADGSEVHMVAVRGEASGVVFAGSTGLLLDRVWIHDTTEEGMHVAPTTSFAGEATIRGSLIEVTGLPALNVYGATAEVIESNIRGTAELATTGPRGINVEPSVFDTFCTVRRSLIESSHEAGIFVAGSEATIEATVMRRIATQGGQTLANGVACQDHEGVGCILTLRQSVVEQTADSGVTISGSDAVIDRTVVRQTAGNPTGMNGYGMMVQLGSDSIRRSNATITASLIAESRNVGLYVGVSDADIDRLLVRDTTATESGHRGWGLAIASVANAPGGSTGTVSRTSIDRAQAAGIVVIGSEGTLEEVLVQDSRPGVFLDHARGVAVVIDHSSATRSTASLSGVTVDGSVGVGILVTGSDAVIERTRVRNVVAGGQADYGDGVVTIGHLADASTYLIDSRIENAARAGILAFGATVSVGSTVLDCNPIHLDGEVYQGADFTFEDRGANRCGCGDAQATCHVVSSNLTAPEPLVDGP
ncbi:MAG: right-handed parallel beta-helix repeat-containing protein [Deltaproteobacteria bacterium]|nr:right-handed parallel beta-helix repeat-containing protein [Deltaproteobacteria bacterium]